MSLLNGNYTIVKMAEQTSSLHVKNVAVSVALSAIYCKTTGVQIFESRGYS